MLHWTEDEAPRSARWRSERGAPPPRRVVLADDTMPADTAYRLACEGTGLLWRGDFHNARQLLLALARRIDRKAVRRGAPTATAATPAAPGAAFHLHRQSQSQRARVLAMLLIPLDADYAIPLRRAPDHRRACTEAWGPPEAEGGPSVVALRELLGIVSAHEWRKKGVPVPALGPAPDNRIHPHHGVFSPVRGEYIELVAKAPLPMPADTLTAFDIGTGTGVLAALLVRRGTAKVVATELEPRALACAKDNFSRLGLGDHVELLPADLFPPGRAGLVICNPPWLPARPGAPIERAVYDEDSGMLKGFLAGLAAHLVPGGEGWLILSDLAEHLGLRTRAELLDWIAAGGLQVRGRIDTRPTHGKAADGTDALHVARAAEVTSLWRLGVRAA
ncbi:MAG: class I SAM-dependent methyltransferase [Rubrivivax sp.]|nr:class I SAM-dependent methyltransferase [Rubrivivax sp.]